MSNLLLSDDERRRFAEYLESEIETTEGIMGQLEKLSGSVIMDGVIKRMKTEQRAAQIIANKLRQTEAL